MKLLMRPTYTALGAVLNGLSTDTKPEKYYETVEAYMEFTYKNFLVWINTSPVPATKESPITANAITRVGMSTLVTSVPTYDVWMKYTNSPIFDNVVLPKITHKSEKLPWLVVREFFNRPYESLGRTNANEPFALNDVLLEFEYDVPVDCLYLGEQQGRPGQTSELRMTVKAEDGITTTSRLISTTSTSTTSAEIYRPWINKKIKSVKLEVVYISNTEYRDNIITRGIVGILDYNNRNRPNAEYPKNIQTLYSVSGSNSGYGKDGKQQYDSAYTKISHSFTEDALFMPRPVYYAEFNRYIPPFTLSAPVVIDGEKV